MFNEIAKQLRQPTGFLGKILSKFLKKMNGDIYVRMVEEVNAQDGDKIYEIGYGHGSGVHQLAANANCTVHGIDFSEVMYNDAVKLNHEFIEEERVELTFGDFLDSDLPSDFYNKLFCVNVIYFWYDLVEPFSKVRKALKSNGTFYIYMDSLEEIKNSRFTNAKNFNLYDVTFVKNELEKVGFTVSHYDFARGHIITAVKS